MSHEPAGVTMTCFRCGKKPRTGEGWAVTTRPHPLPVEDGELIPMLWCPGCRKLGDAKVELSAAKPPRPAKPMEHPQPKPAPPPKPKPAKKPKPAAPKRKRGKNTGTAKQRKAVLDWVHASQEPIKTSDVAALIGLTIPLTSAILKWHSARGVILRSRGPKATIVWSTEPTE